MTVDLNEKTREFLAERKARRLERKEERRILREGVPRRKPGKKRCPRCWSTELVAGRWYQPYRFYKCDACTYEHGRPVDD